MYEAQSVPAASAHLDLAFLGNGGLEQNGRGVGQDSRFVSGPL